PTCAPSAGKRLRRPRGPSAFARLQPDPQSTLDRAALCGHSYGCSSGSSPGESEVSQPHLPRPEPDGQPIESSHLEQFQEKCEAGFRPELRPNNNLERIVDSMKR